MYVEAIVKYINSHLASNLGYRQSKFYGLAKKVKRTDAKEEVVIFDNQGNEISDFISDTYSLSCYHRTISFGFQVAETNQSQSFGRDAGVKKYSLNNTLIIYGDRKRLNITSEELCSNVYVMFPSFLDSASQALLTGVKALSISPLTANLISEQVQQSEGFTVEPENILFQINYKVEVTIDSGCFNGCLNPLTYSNCLTHIRDCTPIIVGTKFLSFQTTANQDSYPLTEISSINGTISDRAWIDKLGVQRNVEFTWDGANFKIIDPLNLPVAGGLFITVAYT